MMTFANKAILRLADAVIEAATSLCEHRARMASLRALEATDNATLRDIGMSRAELMSICLSGTSGRRRDDV